MKKILLAIAFMFFVPQLALASDTGLISKPSKYTVKVTLDRLETILKKKGITIALRWSHSKKASGVGMKMQPTEILIFGNPKMGSPLMINQQTTGIDLPLKALAWQDKNGQVWLTYNSPAYIAKRHGLKGQEKVLKKMTGALNKFSNFATGK